MNWMKTKIESIHFIGWNCARDFFTLQSVYWLFFLFASFSHSTLELEPLLLLLFPPLVSPFLGGGGKLPFGVLHLIYKYIQCCWSVKLFRLECESIQYEIFHRLICYAIHFAHTQRFVESIFSALRMYIVYMVVVWSYGWI